jgi:hypothetical protein
VRAILIGLAAVAAATSASADTWNAYSRSTNNVFMADTDSIASNGDVTSVRVATVPLRGDATDYSHTVETYEFECRARTWRTAGSVEYGPDGAQLDAFPEDGAAWVPVRANTMPDYLHALTCEGARAEPPTWTAVKDFVDAGRP